MPSCYSLIPMTYPIFFFTAMEKTYREGKPDLSPEHKATLLKMGRYDSTSMCHYWDMLEKYSVYSLDPQ